jgi:glycosyltransferase involved in cell wall biosynthesis
MADLSNKLPQVDFIIPTLNAAKVLPLCLKSIDAQNYPKTNINFLIIDGGSTDTTLILAKSFKAKVYSNPLKTGESGKAVGIKHSTSPFLVLLDSDNILPTSNWLRELIEPLLINKNIVGSESWAFTYRPQAGFIERYSALLGANDPYAYFCGIYDRFSHLSLSWTGLPLALTNSDTMVLIALNSQSLPTIGANGTLYRTSFLKKHFNSAYFFDTDFLNSLSLTYSGLLFTKIKNSIIHTYCESSITKFITKQQRRVTDFYVYQPLRRHNWSHLNQRWSLLFPLYSLSLFLPLKDSLIGFSRQRDLAWFFHPLACLITTYVYALGVIQNKLHLLKPLNRHDWKQ